MSKKQIVVIVITVLSAVISAIACALGIPYTEIDVSGVEDVLTETEEACAIPAEPTLSPLLTACAAVSEQDTQTTV